MNLLLDSVIYGLQKFGGISQYWNELSLRVGQAPHVRVSQRMPRKLLSSFPAITRIATSSTDRFNTAAARYLPVAPQGDAPDLVHSSYYRFLATPSIPLVTTVYDFTYEFYRDGIPRAVHSLQKRLALNRSRGLICISASTRDDALKLYPELKAKRVEVIHLASDPNVFYSSDKPRSELPGALRDRGYALFVGQRGGYKRFDLAVQSVAQRPDLCLVVIGPPISEKEKQSLDEALAGRWLAIANASSDDLRLLYTHAELFLYPSDYEGFGLPILDAMACGCPVVCADRSSFPEVAGTAALLVNAQEASRYAGAIAEVMRQGVRNHLIARGRVRAAEFTWEATTAKTLAFYRDVCQAGPI